MQYFQVYSKLPELNEDMISRIPQHRQKIDRLLTMGKVVTYGVSAERDALWMTVYAENEMAVMDLIADLPLNEYLNPEITPLMFHLSPDLMASPSWN
ncbi:MAG: hypothetical protein LPK45_09215 [Bacteroidota bacterium]|nr:hypothetical protein [Bacteroidota bacterium]MDX5431263.1 hypothetical protein [Bacteroidota bacterium]MDX5470002.1 hypothetical protein [Bacteroidota bacterium]